MKMYLKYLKSLLLHKWFVFLECRKLGIWWLGIIHDWSKFLPSEFIPYARYFYGKRETMVAHRERKSGDLIRINGETEYVVMDCYACSELWTIEVLPIAAKDDFDVAWLHHQKRNGHHWQRWELVNDSDEPQYIALPMPDKYRRELLADWNGVGRTYGVPAKPWYLSVGEKYNLHPDTRAWLEEQLGIEK